MDEKRKLPLCKATNGIKSSASLAHIELTTTQDKKLMTPLTNDSDLTTNEHCTTEKSSKTEASGLNNSEIIDKSMTSKRPKGILKTSITGWDESSSADLTADFVGETKSAPLKYVQWTCPAGKNQKSQHEWDYQLNEQDVVKEFSYQYIKPSDRCLSEEQLMEDDDNKKVSSMIKSFEQVTTQIPSKKAVKMEKPLQVSSLNTTKAHIARLNTSMLMQSNDLEQLESHSKSVKDLLADFELKSKENVDTDAPETLHSILTQSDENILMKSEYAEVMKRKNELTKKRRRRKTLTIMNSYDESLMAKSKNMIDNFITRPTITTATGKSDKSALENIYLPMNPRKAILNTDNEYDVDCHPTSMMQSLFANLSGEESSYVEMTRRGLTRSLLAPDEDDDEKLNYTNPHYELVCVADNVIEPVYMEVHNNNNEFVQNPHDYEINSDREPLAMRSELPDILNNLKSDSSDADDESYCKQLDSIGTPRHPRFSLSDTFRPASYYLSTSATHSHMPDMQHDSSDSDLVSPPPIPRSPPPIDDFAASLATSSSNQVQIKGHPEDWTRLMEKYSPAKIIAALRNNQSPLDCTITRELMKLIKPLDEDIYNFSNNTVSTVEEHDNDNEGEEDDCMKRRPINRQQCHALDISDQFELELERSCQMDQQNRQEQQKNSELSCDNSIYANNNEITTRSQASKAFDSSNLLLQKDDKVMTKTNSVSSLPSMRVSDSLPCHHKHSQSFTGYSHYENVSPLHDVTITKSLSSSSSSLIEDDVKKDRSKEKITGDMSSLVKMSSPFSSPQLISRIQQQHFSNQNKESLTSSIGPNVKSPYNTTSFSENAQACISEEEENSAQVQGAPYYYSDLRSQEMYQTQIDVNEAGEDKSIEGNDTKAAYVVQTSHRRSRSLEGLLDDVGLENFMRHQTLAAEAKVSEQNESCNFEGDDPWEQDSLWRESLRMVSMRHAKSLDSLNNSKTDKSSIASSNKQPLDDEKSAIAIKNTQLLDVDCEPSPKIFRELKPKENIHSNQLEGMKSITNNTNRAKTGFELDREKLRQWDLLSSACLLQEQQGTSTAAELFGKGLSSCETATPVTHYLQADTSNVTTMKSVDPNVDEWTLQPDAVYKKLM